MENTMNQSLTWHDRYIDLSLCTYCKNIEITWSSFPSICMQNARTFTIRLKKDPDSDWIAVQCVELPEAISQGKTEEEALKNIREAIELVLEEHEAEARRQGGRLTQISV
jgi:predicted RNase H-like HicB family nuclease